MSPEDGDLEHRLRAELTATRPSDRVDVDEFLSGVRRGARVRRIRRGVSAAAAGVLVVAGGGVAVDAAGLLSHSATPVASGRTTTSLSPTGGGTSLPPSTTQATASTTPTGPPSSTTSAPPPGPVTITAHSALSAAQIKPISLTATGDARQWVLAETPGRDCGRVRCATVLTTDMSGAAGTWTDVGQLPAPPATSDNPSARSVSQLRFVKRNDTTYDGWAFGDALWSTHDSGRSWSAAGSPAGRVTALEAWGDHVYAGVSDTGPGPRTATLYRAPVSSDAWTPVHVGHGLTDVTALAASYGVEGLIDSTSGGRSRLFVSSTGLTWQRADPCPAGYFPKQLSTATDPLTSVGSLWVSCVDSTATVIKYLDTDAPGRWALVQGTFGADVMFAARTPSSADVVGGGIPGIERVSASASPVPVYGQPVGAALYFGFTNEHRGYLLMSDHTILSTSTGGGPEIWSPYAVSATAP